jgi:hypothetical protein
LPADGSVQIDGRTGEVTPVQQEATGPCIPFRLKLGVTGHRQLSDTERLRARVDEVLDRHIPLLFPAKRRNEILGSARTPIVFTVLTPLAEGADRLVAEQVLKRSLSRIEVVLPLTVDDYLMDFATVESRVEFERLLSRARHPISLREAPLAADYPPGEVASARTLAYEDVGRYVVTHCDVLLALWDGEEARGRGGTADVIRYAKETGRPVVIVSTGESEAIELHPGNGIPIEPFFGVEAFNSFVIDQGVIGAYADAVQQDTFDNESGRQLRDDLKAVVREHLLPQYARASTIAKLNQRIYLAAGTVAYSFAAFAVAVVAFGALFLDSTWLIFAIEAVILAASFATVLAANRMSTHRRWIENRFLAERLRAATFLAACGLETSSTGVPAAPGGGPRPGGWMEMVFAEITGRMPALPGCSEGVCEGETAFIRDVWIGRQSEFHAQKARKNRRFSRRIEIGGLIVFGLALVAPVLHLVLFEPLDLVGGMIAVGQDDTYAGVLTFCALALPAVGAAFGGIRMHREYSRLARRSGDMVVALQNLTSSFERVRTPKQLESMARETESLMLLEVQDWLTLTSFSVLEYVA